MSELTAGMWIRLAASTNALEQVFWYGTKTLDSTKRMANIMTSKRALRKTFIEKVTEALSALGFERRIDLGADGEFWFARSAGAMDLEESVRIIFVPGRLDSVGTLCTVQIISRDVGVILRDLPDDAKLKRLVGEPDSGEYYSTVCIEPAASLTGSNSAISGPEIFNKDELGAAVTWVETFVSSTATDWFQKRNSLARLVEIAQEPSPGTPDNIVPGLFRATVALCAIGGDYATADRLIMWYRNRSSYNFFDSKERFSEFTKGLKREFPELTID
ncbi:hypothetical protein ACFVJ5_22005 [Nocardia sp. NPDC127606]|uniref:hypothetical protein n=1 Tax=unclassified Nocardia TaxID=2637762 RepID=UPI003644A417